MRLKKKCSLCGVNKRLSEYWKHIKAKDGLYAHCKSCHLLLGRKTREKYRDKYREKARIISARWRKNHPELSKERNKIYRERHKDRYNENSKLKRLELRKYVISNFGGKCECCGISDYRFLTIDHVNSDGRLYRKEIYKNYGKYMKDIIKNNFPKNLQLLCFNCNMGRQFYGGKDKTCPHKIKI